jgi:ketosteroid isomerase-like protein
MSDEDESVVRAAYEAYGQGEVNRLLELVHPDLEWTYLDPSMENPQPQTCHGREQLAWALGQQADRSLVLTLGPGTDRRAA